MNSSDIPCDILIIGGGMVGATLACALEASGYRIVLVEARLFGNDSHPSYDDRSTAIAQGSRRIFEQLGLWDELAPAAEPILTIHVSDRGRFGVSRLDHAEEGVDALGYVIENRVLGGVLARRLDRAQRALIIAPAQVEGLSRTRDRVRVGIIGERAPLDLQARLVIVADGAESTVRALLGMKTHERAYGQTAVIANVTPELNHRNTAYERFTDSGPLAVLPLGSGRCSVVMTVWNRDVAKIMSMDDQAFLNRLQRRFGQRLGRIMKVGKRGSYPLTLTESRSQTAERVILLGNAARALHPVAGQGFNLALRDLGALAELLLQAAGRGADPGGAALAREFLQGRRGDQRRTVLFTDLLARLFASRFPPLAHLRSAGLVAVDLIPFLHHRLARQSMGMSERLPRLSLFG